MSTLLMSKDIPVLEILSNGSTIIKNYNLLPVNIRKRDVNIEDFYSEWINNRAISVSRTNAKAILNSLRISQTNASAICRACHGVNLLDSYWMKDSGEDLAWKDVSLYQNALTKSLAVTALTGKSGMRENGKIHTPELTTQGVSAKAWWREQDFIYLYKVGKKELAASRILDALGIEHVKYEEVDRDRLKELVTDERKDFLDETGEKVVKCRLLTDEDRAMVSFEEFAVFCEYEGKNPYKEVLKMDAGHYYEMQVADYILSNDDRHIGNWGFYMDSNTGELGKLYPLLDHDHAFSEREYILSQTSEQEESLLFAAVKAQKQAKINLEAVREIEKPGEISAEQWNRVLKNAVALSSHCRLMEQMEKQGFCITEKAVQWYEKIRKVSGREYSLAELCRLCKNASDISPELQKAICEFGNELKVQEAVGARLEEAGREPQQKQRG